MELNDDSSHSLHEVRDYREGEPLTLGEIIGEDALAVVEATREAARRRVATRQIAASQARNRERSSTIDSLRRALAASQ